jgi:hypothetical protein
MDILDNRSEFTDERYYALLPNIKINLIIFGHCSYDTLVSEYHSDETIINCSLR